MKKQENQFFQDLINNFEYRTEKKLTDSEKHILIMELDILVGAAFDDYWQKSQEAYRESRKQFRRTF